MRVPAVERLTAARDAASLVAAWTAVESALQTIASDRSLVGQLLVRDLRQRNILTLGQGHALIEFIAARDRAQAAGYVVTDADVAAVNDAFAQLSAGPVADVPVSSPVPVATPIAAPAPSRGVPPALLGLITVLALAGIGLGVVMMMKKGKNGAIGSQAAGTGDALAGAIASYNAGRVDSARALFTAAARADTMAAEPHIYLGRIARESGDLTTARSELVTAVRLAPDNAVAEREMGAVLLAAGQYDLAKKFYTRAITLDPSDPSALGFFGCTLMRLGQTQEGTKFLARAGQGPWSVCATAAK